MFRTLTTLARAASATSEARVRDTFAIELIDQKIREAGADLRAAKHTLAVLIQRARSERSHIEALDAQIADLTTRATDALAADREDLATEAAEAIAGMENERAVRSGTLAQLDAKVTRLEQAVKTAGRRLVDLKQGALQARAKRREEALTSRLRTRLERGSNADEAAELIRSVMDTPDPVELSDIIAGIDDGTGSPDLADRMADAGFGKPSRATGASVLARIKSQN